MPNCDLCNTEVSWASGTQVGAADFRRLVANGLEPDESMFAMAAAMGMDRQQALQHWKANIVGQSSGWLLCAQCCSRARNYGL